jgi:hypothetical protein
VRFLNLAHKITPKMVIFKKKFFEKCVFCSELVTNFLNLNLGLSLVLIKLKLKPRPKLRPKPKPKPKLKPKLKPKWAH